MMIYPQELQGEWPKLRGYVKERWGQLDDNALNIQGDNSAQLDGEVRQETGDSRVTVERVASDVMSFGPWAIEGVPLSVDGSAAKESARSPL